MKRILLLSCLSIFCFTIAFSQINYTDYGEGLVVAMEENYPMDIDGNGVTDFYINKHNNELGFTPVFGVGCIASPSAFAITAFGAREMQLFEEGETIELTDINMFDYIDEDRGSSYSSTGGFAENWAHMEYQYIGFVVFDLDNFDVANGWMRIAVDIEAQTLIIKEIAYQDFQEQLTGGHIIAGDTGVSAVKNLDQVLDEVNISPNPVVDLLQLSFDYSGNEKLQISILDNTGKIVTTQSANGSANYSFNTSDWTAGLYFVNFSTTAGVRSEKIFVSK